MMTTILFMMSMMLWNLNNLFMGLILYLFMFIIFLGGFYLWGVEGFKGDLYGDYGMDYISFYMILLLMWVCSVVLILFNSYMLVILVIFLMLSISLMFMSINLVYLFIYFEFSMIPMFMMIMFLGGSKERYMASVYMFIYTMISSLPALLIMMIMNSWTSSMSIDYLFYYMNDLDMWVKMIIIIMFLVKVPMFIIHIWLPKAHVEAPVYGSMILASIMLKMGGYGIIRCMDFMVFGIELSDFFFSLCLTGVFVVSYSCLFQIDLKVLVAYSSIVHMAMMLVGFFSGSELGYMGGIIMMMSHGICSSGMFYLVNEIYLVSGSRLLLMNKGIYMFAPILIWMWLIMLVNNLGIPPCFGILGELMLFTSVLGHTSFLSLILMISIFFISCFVINMYIYLVGGMCMFRLVNINLLSYYGGIIHLIPMSFLIFWFNFI